MQEPAKQFRKRNAILSCLRASRAHPSAEMLFRQLQQTDSDISLASVYRNLTYFRDHGLIISLGTVGGAERFDGRIDPHIHFACTQCGRVEDLPEEAIPAELAASASAGLGCRVDGVQIMLSGRCKDCLPKETM